MAVDVLVFATQLYQPRRSTYWASSTVDDLVESKSLWNTGGSVGVTRSERSGGVVSVLAIDGLALGWAAVGE